MCVHYTVRRSTYFLSFLLPILFVSILFITRFHAVFSLNIHRHTHTQTPIHKTRNECVLCSWAVLLYHLYTFWYNNIAQMGKKKYTLTEMSKLCVHLYVSVGIHSISMRRTFSIQASELSRCLYIATTSLCPTQWSMKPPKKRFITLEYDKSFQCVHLFLFV